MAWFGAHGIKSDNTLYDIAGPDELAEWISTNDIGALAATILQDPIEKHGTLCR